MSRKQDPIVRVVEFFESAGLGVAQTALALAKAIVKKRTPSQKPVQRRRRVKKVTTPAAPQPDAAAITLGAKAPEAVQTTAVRARGSAPSARRRRSTQTVAAAAPPAGGKPLDLALPGLGPSTVGE